MNPTKAAIVSVSRTFTFCAAHRLLIPDSKCRFLHGHNYSATVSLEGPLNQYGMVVDFADMKRLIGGWIDANWDHNTILCDQDPLVKACNIESDGGADYESIWNGREPFVTTANPTAENLSLVLLSVVEGIIRECQDRGHWNDVRVAHVSVVETDNCSAGAQPVSIPSI